MKAKSFFGIFVAMALVPLVLAYLVLKFGWFTPGATAKGEFVEHDIQLENLGQQTESQRPMWRIVYQPSANCDALCEEQLYGLNQTHTALGKLQKRVDANVLIDTSNSQSAAIDLNNYPHLTAQSATHAQLDSGYLYIIDPFGKAIMRYKGSIEREQTIKISKFILADLKKLLNYARVG